MNSVWSYITTYMSMITVMDVIDIIIVAFAIYKISVLVKESKAWTIIKGIAILFVVLQLSEFLKLNVVNYILKNFMQVGLLAVVIIFQPELRRALDRMGKSRINIFHGNASINESTMQAVDQICDAAVLMSADKVGALIVIERQMKINEIIETGVPMNAEVTKELICNIFFPNTPLHDGAVVIRDDKVASAGCLLPLSQRDGISKELGTRHRAAMGMSEMADSAIVVVSEETGKISFAIDGVLTRNLSRESLKRSLMKVLSDERDDTAKKNFKEKAKEFFEKFKIKREK